MRYDESAEKAGRRFTYLCSIFFAEFKAIVVCIPHRPHRNSFPCPDAHNELKKYIENKNYEPAADLLGECQRGAIELGGLIEKTEGEDQNPGPLSPPPKCSQGNPTCLPYMA